MVVEKKNRDRNESSLPFRQNEQARRSTNCIMKSSVASNRGPDRNNWRNPVIRSGIGSKGRSLMRNHFVAMRGMFVMKKVTRIETNVNGRTSLWLCLLWTKNVIVRME